MNEKIVLETGAKAKNKAYHFEMPESLFREIRILAAERGTTMKAIVLDALEAEARRCMREREHPETPATTAQGKIIL